MPKRKRFIILDDESLAKKSAEQKNVHTQKAEERADRAFRTFLQACGLDENNCDYWDFTTESLDSYLAKFWFGARKNIIDDSKHDENEEESENEEDPELKERMYSANSLRNYRYALGRIMKKKTGLDIISKESAQFAKSTEAFTDAMKELKKNGKGEIKNKSEISENGMLCRSTHLTYFRSRTISRQLFAIF